MKMTTPFLPLVAACLLASCADPADDDDIDARLDVPADDAASEIPDAVDVPEDAPADRPWTPPGDSRVYVNTETTLYYIDPAVAPDLVEVGDFSGPCTAGSGLYDIAADADGALVGIAAEALYAVDHDTAACTLLREFPDGAPHFFSLSWAKGYDAGDPEAEALFAASVEEGEWVRIDPRGTTLATIFRHVGWYEVPDHPFGSSGDIVSLQTGPDTFRTFATLKCAAGYTEPGCESDWLAEIDPETGDARMIGAIGFTRLFGLGFWGDKVYGFSGGGEYILIDVDTGEGTLVREFSELRFWGAGTTTRPYVLI